MMKHLPILVGLLGLIGVNGQSCQIEQGIDYRGNDVSVGSSTTADACCQECSSTAGCTAWTLWSGGPQCYLKSSAAGRVASAGHISGTVASPDKLFNETDCAMRSFFIDYAATVNPNIDATKAEFMREALMGDPDTPADCQVKLPSKFPTSSNSAIFSPKNGIEYFADALAGNDSNEGTEAAPFLTIERAVEAVRAAGQQGGTVTLIPGVFHLSKALSLTSADSYLVIQTKAGSESPAWLSGSVPLTGLTWKPVNVQGGANVWAADLSPLGITELSGLRANQTRYWPARYPNGNPESSFPFTAEIKAESWITTPGTFPPAKIFQSLVRNDTISRFNAYRMTTGASSCAKYDPPISYYCSDGADAGGGTKISGSSLPNQPYANPQGAVITAAHGGLWCSFSYKVDAGYSYDDNSKVGTFPFSSGGQQCNRPEGGHNELFIENVLEELDQAGEFHFDPVSHVLTVWHNATSGTPPPSDGSLQATQLDVLINITGSQQDPVVELALNGLGFRDTAVTSFVPHVAPTAGDWSVNRHAAITARGTMGLAVGSSSFTRLDNAGVFLGGFHRDVIISDNDFAWLGESAIVSVGETSDPGLEDYPGFGSDGSAGEQPRNTRILRNFAREIGIVNKQSGFYFQAATSNSTVEGNVVFNGARSGINFNDGFGIGSRVTDNVLFNLNRETADHGCFNSWDRLAFHQSKDKTHRDVLTGNLFFSNFNSYNGIDTDDDSAYYLMKDNVLYLGHMLKSDFSGHDIEYTGLLGVFTDPCNQYQPVPVGHINSFHDNTVISKLDGDNLFSNLNCTDTSDWPYMDSNVVYSPSASTTVCSQTMDVWQDKGLITNTTTKTLPASASIIMQMVKDKLY